MAEIVYILGAASTLLCAVLLLRRYRVVHQPLLLWSGLCFCGLTLTNTLIFIDLVLIPDVDLHLWRLGVVAVSMSLLVYGLVWETK
jgi:uncharacterized protein DUF5985